MAAPVAAPAAAPAAAPGAAPVEATVAAAPGAAAPESSASSPRCARSTVSPSSGVLFVAAAWGVASGVAASFSCAFVSEMSSVGGSVAEEESPSGLSVPEDGVDSASPLPWLLWLLKINQSINQ